MLNKTNILDLDLNISVVSNSINNNIVIKSDDLIPMIVDSYNSYEYRIQAYNRLRSIDLELANHIIHDICSSFRQAGSRDLRDFIIYLIDNARLDIFIKIDCVLVLKEEKYPKIRHYLLSILDDYKLTTPSIAIFIDILRYSIEPRQPYEIYSIDEYDPLIYGHIYSPVLQSRPDAVRQLQ